MFFTLLVLLGANETYSQLSESDTSSFQLRIGLSGIRQKGNVDLSILRGRIDVLEQVSSSFVFKSQNNGLYQQFSGFKVDQDFNSHNYLYYKPQSQWYPFAMVYYQTNFRLRVNQRIFGGTGITYQLIRENHHNIKISGSIVYEETHFSSIRFNENAYNGNSLITIWRPTFYLMGLHYLSDKKVRIYYSAYWQYGLDQVQNQRVHAEAGIDFKIWKGLSFAAQYLWLFEQVVAYRVVQKDNIFTVGLTYQFTSKQNKVK